MDESERLIARAALGSPAEAVGLWQQWRETYDPATASDLLVWAGGYVHRNIVADGSRDDYLAGIARHNWVANQRQLLAAPGDLVDLATTFPLTTLKSFDTARADGALSLRPVADIDVYVDDRHVTRAVRFLRERGFVPLLDASDTEIFDRIVPLRGSWNFTRPAGTRGAECSIDLHWKLFDGLTPAHNRSFARRYTIPHPASFGDVRGLIPEARFALMAVQRRAQDDGKDTDLFDAGHIVADLAPRTLRGVARATHSHASVLALLDALSEFSTSPRIADLRAAISRDAEKRAVRSGVAGARVKTGSPSAVRRQPIVLDQETNVIRVAQDLPSGTGWFYVLPGDTWRWTTTPEARLTFAIDPYDGGVRGGAPTSAVITVHLNAEAWAVGSALSVDMLCNGRLLGRIDKPDPTKTFTLPLGRRTRTLHLRLRGTAADLPASDPRSLVFNRIVAPVESVEIRLS